MPANGTIRLEHCERCYLSYTQEFDSRYNHWTPEHTLGDCVVNLREMIDSISSTLDELMLRNILTTHPGSDSLNEE